MPEMDGYGLMRRVRALSTPMRRIPAIAVSFASLLGVWRN
jgi:CheY-like chemotaxis protein